jgi:hypothetical protein
LDDAKEIGDSTTAAGDSITSWTNNQEFAMKNDNVNSAKYCAVTNNGNVACAANSLNDNGKFKAVRAGSENWTLGGTDYPLFYIRSVGKSKWCKKDSGYLKCESSSKSSTDVFKFILYPIASRTGYSFKNKDGNSGYCRSVSNDAKKIKCDQSSNSNSNCAACEFNWTEQ